MSELDDYSARLMALIGNLTPAARKSMASDVAKRLRARQQASIKRQQAPGGAPFKPRKAQPLRGKKGRVKREMFTKLRTAKYMKAKGTGDGAYVELASSVQRMARVHHYGLRDRPTKSVKAVPYEPRQLLGITAADRQMIEDAIVSHLTR